MATANEELFDEAVRRRIRLEFFSNRAAEEIRDLLRKAEDDVFQRLRQMEGTVSSDSFSQARLQALFASIKEQRRVFDQEIRSRIAEEMRAVASDEVESTLGSLRRAVPIQLNFASPGLEQVAAAAQAQPFRGKFLEGWAKNIAEGQLTRVEDAVRLGFVEGDSIDRIVRRLRGTKKAKFRDGILETSRRGAEAVVRTAVTHTSDVARRETYKRNNNVIKGVRYTATLDGRTTLRCITLDGKVFEIDEGPRPPQHMGCRSVTVPITKSWRELGFNRDELPASTRASMDGQVPDATTYPEFLRRQPASFQDEVLGPTRARLFRQGGLSVDKFQNRQGRTYTVDELRRRERETWEEVFGAVAA